MKKKVALIIGITFSSLVTLVVAAVICFLGYFYYVSNIKLTDISTQISPDGKYTATLQMVGNPISFSDTDAKITVTETKSKKVVETIDASVCDDGAVLGEEHWSVVWKDDSVEITLSGSEQEDHIYIVEL